MTPGQFAFLLGYGIDKGPGEGNRFANRNARTTVIRYEKGVREIPPMVARFVQMLVWYKIDHDKLPDFEAMEWQP